MPRFNHRRRSPRRKPPLPRAEAERRLRRRRVQDIFEGWGRPTPPTPREVQRIVAKSNASRTQSAHRQRRKQSTSDAFRRRKVQRREYWRRRLGQAPEVGMGGSSAPITKQQPRLIPARERRASGMAPMGPRTTLTVETAQAVADCLEAGLSVRATAEKTGVPPSTVSHWDKSGRLAVVLAAQPRRPQGDGV